MYSAFDLLVYFRYNLYWEDCVNQTDKGRDHSVIAISQINHRV